MHNVQRSTLNVGQEIQRSAVERFPRKISERSDPTLRVEHCALRVEHCALSIAH
jgi:hypothetical protein